jgi:hypothetical protein
MNRQRPPRASTPRGSERATSARTSRGSGLYPFEGSRCCSIFAARPRSSRPHLAAPHAVRRPAAARRVPGTPSLTAVSKSPAAPSRSASRHAAATGRRGTPGRSSAGPIAGSSAADGVEPRLTGSPLVGSDPDQPARAAYETPCRPCPKPSSPGIPRPRPRLKRVGECFLDGVSPPPRTPRRSSSGRGLVRAGTRDTLRRVAPARQSARQSRGSARDTAPAVSRIAADRATCGSGTGGRRPAVALATPLPRCRACVRRSAPRGDRAACGSGTEGPRPARSVAIPLPTRGATSAPARCDRQPPGPGRHRRTPRPRVARAGARATARSAEVMRDTAGAVSPAQRRHPGIDDLQSSSFAGLTAGGVECNSTIPGDGPRMRPTGVPTGHPRSRSAVTPGVGRRPSGRGGTGFALATPLRRCRACVRRSAPRGDRATCGSGTGGPRPVRSVAIPQPTRGATSAPARCDRQPPGPGKPRRTPVLASREPVRGPRRGAPRSRHQLNADTPGSTTCSRRLSPA